MFFCATELKSVAFLYFSGFLLLFVEEKRFVENL
jgi:hypothetical protein